MTTTEPTGRTSQVRDLITELLADEIGREALISVLLAELADREIVCRRLRVRDQHGRDRVDANATSTSAGGVRVFSFSEMDAVNFVEIAGNEECEEPFVHVSLTAGDEYLAQIEAHEGRYGYPGAAWLRLDEYESDMTKRRARHLRSTVVDVDGVTVGEKGGDQ